MSKHYHTILSIAGSDPVGGAGIQADIKTATALGVYAMTAVTAVTAQNTLGVDGYEAVSPRLLTAQLDAVGRDVRPDAVKIGMVPHAEAVEIIAWAIRKFGWNNIVLDPVMVATSGDSLSSTDTLQAMRTLLFPIVAMLTPNIPEAQLISGMEIPSPDCMAAAAGRILASGVKAVLLKGGHLTESDTLTDVFISGSAMQTCSRPKVATRNTHGTGCSLSSAIASFLAMGCTPLEAACRGGDWLWKAIADGADYSFGHGHGPVNHLFEICNPQCNN